MLTDDNRRSFNRLDIDCPASVQIGHSGQLVGAIVKNLSGGGFLLWMDQAFEEGSEIELTVSPKTPITPPLSARVKVVRCTPIPDSEGGHAVACAILEVLPSADAEAG